MRLVTYEVCGMQSVGVMLDDQVVVDVQSAYGLSLKTQGRSDWKSVAERNAPRDMTEFLTVGEPAWEAARAALAFAQELPADKRARVTLSEGSYRLLAPVTNPTKIICVGLNYKDHADEGGHALPTTPVLFSAYNTAVNHPGADVPMPKVADKMVDWEAELAIVIGKHGRFVSEEDAMDYVAGYTVSNDVSVRDYQMKTSQYMAGKTFDGHVPMGPWLADKHEIPDPHVLDIKMEINGEVTQHSNTKHLIFNVPFLVSYMSKIWTLEPGDVIITGTMAGVGFRMDPQRFLKAGDVARVTVEKIGVLENRFVPEEEWITSL